MSPDANIQQEARPARRRSYRSGFLYGGLGFALAAALGFVSMIATSRLYGVHIIGQFALVSAPVAALWVLSTVKEQQALIREITGLQPREPRVTQLFAAVFSFSSALTTIVALLDAGVCAIVFPGPLHQPELLPAALVSIAGYVLVTNTGWNIDSILSAFLAAKQIFWVRLHEVLSFIVIAVALGFVAPSVWGLVAATIGASLTSLVHRAWAAREFVRGRLSAHEYKRGLDVLPGLLRFGVRASPGQVAQGASQQGGVWVLGAVAPVAVVGAYSRAQMIPQRLQQASMRISEVLYPTLVGRHADGDGEGFDRVLVDSIRYEVVGLLAIAAAVGGAAHAVLALFGPGFGQAATALALLAAYPALAAATVTQTQALWAANRPGLTSLIAFARAAVTIAMLLALTPTLGAVGPALSILAGYVTVLVLSGLALRSTLARPLLSMWSRRERAALACAYVIGFLVARGVEASLSSPVSLLLALAASVASYTAVFTIAGGVNERDRARAREGWKALRTRHLKAARVAAS